MAAHEFIVGPCSTTRTASASPSGHLKRTDTARRGTYRVSYRIDDEERSASVIDAAHRGAYRRA